MGCKDIPRKQISCHVTTLVEKLLERMSVGWVYDTQARKRTLPRHLRFLGLEIGCIHEGNVREEIDLFLGLPYGQQSRLWIWVWRRVWSRKNKHGRHLGQRLEGRVMRMVRGSRTKEKNVWEAPIPVNCLELNSQNWISDLKLHNYIFQRCIALYSLLICK